MRRLVSMLVLESTDIYKNRTEAWIVVVQPVGELGTVYVARKYWTHVGRVRKMSLIHLML